MIIRPKFGPWTPRRPGFSTAPQIYSLDVTQARVGASVAVTIRGAGFSNCAIGTPPQVTFGGLAATSVVVVDSNTISCLSPVAVDPGIVDVVVTVGCC